MSVSSEKLSAMAGSIWDKGDAIGLAFAKDKGVNVIHTKQLGEEWVHSVKGRGVDAALKELRTIAKNYGE